MTKKTSHKKVKARTEISETAGGVLLIVGMLMIFSTGYNLTTYLVEMGAVAFIAYSGIMKLRYRKKDKVSNVLTLLIVSVCLVSAVVIMYETIGKVAL